GAPPRFSGFGDGHRPCGRRRPLCHPDAFRTRSRTYRDRHDRAACARAGRCRRRCGPHRSRRSAGRSRRQPMTDTPLLLDDVSLVHGDGDEMVTALAGVMLSVEAGEFVAVVGPPGAGKSSLLAVAGGLTPPTSGTVAVGGVQLTGLSPRRLTALRRKHIGFVFQTNNLVPALSALDQVRLPLT